MEDLSLCFSHSGKKTPFKMSLRDSMSENSTVFFSALACLSKASLLGSFPTVVIVVFEDLVDEEIEEDRLGLWVLEEAKDSFPLACRGTIQTR
jgi:hypothetical protein